MNDEKTHTPQGYEPPAEESAVVEFAVVFAVGPEAGGEDEEVGEGLVDLCVVLGHGFAVALEDEAPGEGGLYTVDFAVEEIAQADEGTTQCHDNDEAVEQPPGVYLVFAAPEPDGKQDGDGGTVAGKAFVAGKVPLGVEGQEDFKPVLGGAEVVGLVEEAVPQAGAHQRGQEHP